MFIIDELAMYNCPKGMNKVVLYCIVLYCILETAGWGTSHRRTKNVTNNTKQSSFVLLTPHNDDRDAQLKR